MFSDFKHTRMQRGSERTFAPGASDTGTHAWIPSLSFSIAFSCRSSQKRLGKPALPWRCPRYIHARLTSNVHKHAETFQAYMRTISDIRGSECVHSLRFRQLSTGAYLYALRVSLRFEHNGSSMEASTTFEMLHVKCLFIWNAIHLGTILDDIICHVRIYI